MRFSRRLACIAALLLIPAIVIAQQDYPSKPIRVIVPFPAGGSADLVARTVGQRFLDNTKQPFIVENRAGADTIIAMDLVKNAPADGYTVGYTIGSALTMNPTLYTKLSYDPVKDYVPVMVIANVPLALVVHPSIAAKNVQELAALIKARPGEIFYGQANIVAKVATLAFSMAAGGSMTEIAYKGSTPNVQALVVSEVKVAIEPVATVLPHVQAGKLRALAVTDSRRSTAFADLPTVAESGIAGYAFNNWHAILVPATTPKDVVNKLHAELVRAARHPEVAARVQPLGVEIVAGTPDELQQRVTTEREHWAKQIKAMGIRLD